MKVRVLGCYGGEALGAGTVCFLVNDTFAIDSGSLTSALTVEEQRKVDYILITHSHFDHIKGIPFLIDNIFGTKNNPVEVLGLPQVIESLKAHVFNDVTWPDFTQLPTPDKPVMKYRVIKNINGFRAGGLQFQLFPVNHTTETVGVKISADGASIIISSDTGPTEMLWKVANTSRNLKAMFVETSFPNSLQGVADASLHYTPATLGEDLKKLKKDVPVYVYHLKPGFLDVLTKELNSVNDSRIRILEQGSVLTF